MRRTEPTDTSADAVPGGNTFLSPKVAHHPNILSSTLGSSLDPNPGSRVLTPLYGLKSCRESWRWKRHLARVAAEGVLGFSGTKGPGKERAEELVPGGSSLRGETRVAASSRPAGYVRSGKRERYTGIALPPSNLLSGSAGNIGALRALLWLGSHH